MLLRVPCLATLMMKVSCWMDRTDDGNRSPPDDQDQAVFFLAAFSMLAKLVRSDGRVSDAEIGAIERFMIRDLGMGPEKRRDVYAIFEAALQSPETFEDFATQFYHQFQQNRN